jgi:hypothetical protein
MRAKPRFHVIQRLQDGGEDARPEVGEFPG